MQDKDNHFSYLSEQDREKITKKGPKKFFSRVLASQLLKHNPDSTLYKSYKHTLNCYGDILPGEDGRISTRHCKNRWCTLCNNIRTGKLINGYEPQFKDALQAGTLYFVTLTIPNVKGPKLAATIKKMYHDWTVIRKSREFSKMKPRGLRKFEVTHNLEEETYHPHFHVVIEGKSNAEYLVNNWLRLNPRAEEIAQDIRQADDNSFRELFKYFTKLVAKKSKPGTDKKTHKEEQHLFFKMLDFSNETIRGMRTFQPFGPVHMVNEEPGDDDRMRFIKREDIDFIELPEDYIFKWRVDKKSSRMNWWNKFGDVLAVEDMQVPAESLQEHIERKGLSGSDEEQEQEHPEPFEFSSDEIINEFEKGDSPPVLARDATEDPPDTDHDPPFK